MSADPLFSTLRISTLVLCMATAARSDYETLHVRDSHWVKWAAPASLLLASELVTNNSGLSNICMVAALISAFSICFVNPPDPRKAREWGRIEASVFAFFIIGSIGILGGASGKVVPTGIMRKSLNVSGIYVGSKTMFQDMLNVMDASKLMPIIDQIFSFNSVKDSFHLMKSGKHFGKIVVSFDDA